MPVVGRGAHSGRLLVPQGAASSCPSAVAGAQALCPGVEVTPADLESALREVGGNRYRGGAPPGHGGSTLYRLLRRLPSTETADTDA